MGRSGTVGLYLAFYNFCLWLGFVYTLYQLSTGTLHHTYRYESLFPLFRLLTLLQFADVAHSVLGFTKTSLSSGLIQTFGRLFILYLIHWHPFQHDHIVSTVLMFAYMSIEVVRYPYYICRALDTDIMIFEWLRYNAWLILYPLGLSMEWLCLVRCLYRDYTENAFGHVMPQAMFGMIVVVFTFGLFPLISSRLLGYMWSQRQKKFAVQKRQE